MYIKFFLLSKVSNFFLLSHNKNTLLFNDIIMIAHLTRRALSTIVFTCHFTCSLVGHPLKVKHFGGVMISMLASNAVYRVPVESNRKLDRSRFSDVDFQAMDKF
jgi:isopentenyldiphosphate isomerase